MSEPREGLPPCMGVVRLDNRYATMRDMALCDGKHTGGTRFWVIAGELMPPHSLSSIHPEFSAPWHLTIQAIMSLPTNDPDKAQAAFDKGAEYVRTGVMP